MNLVLTGLRGSGKTYLGKILAQKLGWNFVDTDEQIEKHENKKIIEIVNLRGWEYFRAVENKIAKEVSALDKTVIATGGGMIIDPENETALKKNGKIIYLYVKPEKAAARILNDDSRPRLTNKETVEEEIQQLYKERNDRYIKSSNLLFQRTDDAKADADEIISKLSLK